MIEIQPSIELFGIRVDEPMTTLTDMVVSAVCLVAFIKLTKSKLPGKTQFYFRLYFLFMCIATFVGGLFGHGFLYAVGFAWKLPGWIFSMISIALIERSSIEHAKSLVDPRVGKFFLVLNIVELVIIMAVTISTLNFKWVEFHTGYGFLAVVLPFHFFVYYKTRDRGSMIVMGAILVVIGAALIFMNRISAHIWFNHVDISHVLMATGAWVFYRGALQLLSREGEPSLPIGHPATLVQRTLGKQ